MELQEFISISKYAGERFDLVQAGGGNSSVKYRDGSMVIKSSGYLLSDMSVNKGFSVVENFKINDIFVNECVINCTDKQEKDAIVAKLVQQSVLKGERPSIETLLHSFLKKYVLHTHPLVVNSIVIRQDWEEIIQKLFPDEHCVTVCYKTPGIELAIELKSQIENYADKNNVIPDVIFLQNHGLIVNSDFYDEVITKTEKVVQTFEEFLGADFDKYKMTSGISRLVNTDNSKNYISYLSEDAEILSCLKSNKELFFTKPFCPDKMVYCGYGIVELNSLNEREKIKEYITNCYEIPKVILFGDKIFFIAESVKKAKELEEVFKFHVMALKAANTNKINYLSDDEVSYIGNWEAEKYRQKI